MSPLQVHQFICRTDNFGLLLHEPSSGATASIDSPDATAIGRELMARGWRLSHIFNTHHHHDHVPGNLELKRVWGCCIVGAKRDATRIPGIDVTLDEDAVFDFAGHAVRMIDTPGHTLGSVCYFLPDDQLLFTGDTLFSLGCGRLFEGSAADLWISLCKISALPDATLVYCGHEYTLANAEFALEMEPDNAALRQRAEAVRQQRRARQATLPVPLATEKATNPFLRPHSHEIRRRLGMEAASDVDVLARLRALKDEF